MKINEFNGQPILDEKAQAKHNAYIDGLRGLADFYETHPNLPAPVCTTEAVILPNSKQELAALARAAGSLEKTEYCDGYFLLKKDFGPIVFRLLVEKSKTCERVKVGEDIIPAEPEHVVPEHTVPEAVIPAKPERVIEKFEWKCPPSILANGSPAATVQPVTESVGASC